jgi:hypothetical protein
MPWEGSMRIELTDPDGATEAALFDALAERIDLNLGRLRHALSIIEEVGDIEDCGDEDCYDCTRDILDREEAEHDAVGYAIDSLRLARIIQALGDDEAYFDCTRCGWQLIETGEPGVCDTCGWDRRTWTGPAWSGKRGDE